MLFVSLRSGSNGNGYLLSDGDTTLMFDAGVPRGLVCSVLRNLGIPQPEVIFLSHEHSDHVRSLDALVPFVCDVVCATAGTLGALWDVPGRATTLSVWETASFGRFAVTFVPKPHDAAEPVGFLVEHTSGKSAALFVDLGHPTKEVIEAARISTALLIEANYEPRLLRLGRYPRHLKLRISGPFGHLSNRQCASLLEAAVHENLEVVVLGHLSEENNTPTLALAAAGRKVPPSAKLFVASRYKPLVVEL